MTKHHSTRSSSQPVLQISQDAPSIWHKDVGGKKKCMTVEVELVGVLDPSAKYGLSSSLHYESGKKVSEEWQYILAVDDEKSDSLLDEQHRHAQISFRIEKVSTSFMSQRFKVRLLATRCDKPYMAGECLDVFTTAIESKAKPKRCSANKGNKGTTKRQLLHSGDCPDLAKRRRRRGIKHYEDALEKATQIIQQMEHRLTLSERTMEVAVCKLQETVAKLQAIEGSRSIRVPPLAPRRKSFTKLELTSRELSELQLTTKLETVKKCGDTLEKVPLSRMTSKDWPLFCFPAPSQTELDDAVALCFPLSSKLDVEKDATFQLPISCASQFVSSTDLCQLGKTADWLFPSIPSVVVAGGSADLDPALDYGQDSSLGMDVCFSL